MSKASDEMINACTEINGKVVYMQDMIMEDILGRPLKANEFVIHENGNSLDNRRKNLILCTEV